jgi:hypothetical protein
MKKRTIYISDKGYNHVDFIKGIEEEIGGGRIHGVVKTGLTWQITLKEGVEVEDLAESGLRVKGDDVEVKLVSRNIVTVSFLGVPSYISEDELSERLREFGVTQKAPWTRKKYADYPEIESGILFTRIEIPSNVASLPYATKISYVYVSVKHNGQTKVCNRCLSPDHLARSCPEGIKCYYCGLPGHIKRNCPDLISISSTSELSSVWDTDDDDDRDTVASISNWAAEVDDASGSDEDYRELIIDEREQPITESQVDEEFVDKPVEVGGDPRAISRSDSQVDSRVDSQPAGDQTSKDGIMEHSMSTAESPVSKQLKRPRQHTTDEDKEAESDGLNSARSPRRRNKRRVAAMSLPPAPKCDITLTNKFDVLKENENA